MFNGAAAHRDGEVIEADKDAGAMVCVVVGSSHSLYGTIFAEIVVAVLFVVMDVVDGMRSCVVFRDDVKW